MSITITITDPTPAQIAALFGGDAAKPAAKTEQKVSKPDPKAAAEESKPEASNEGPAAPTHDEVVAAAQALVTANGREALAELLTELGAKNLSGIAEKDRADFIAKATAKVA